MSDKKTVTFRVNRTEITRNEEIWLTEITLDEIRKSKPFQTKGISDEEVILQVELCPEDYMELYEGKMTNERLETIDIKDHVETIVG